MAIYYRTSETQPYTNVPYNRYVYFNGTPLNKVFFNGVKVWERQAPITLTFSAGFCTSKYNMDNRGRHILYGLCVGSRTKILSVTLSEAFPVPVTCSIEYDNPRKTDFYQYVNYEASYSAEGEIRSIKDSWPVTLDSSWIPDFSERTDYKNAVLPNFQAGVTSFSSSAPGDFNKTPYLNRTDIEGYDGRTKEIDASVLQDIQNAHPDYFNIGLAQGLPSEDYPGISGIYCRHPVRFRLTFSGSGLTWRSNWIETQEIISTLIENNPHIGTQLITVYPDVI